MTTNPDEQFKQELLKRGLKLWKPPYYGVQDSEAALRDLAQTFEQIDALAKLKHFQEHALGKLRDKHKVLEELTIQIIGMDLEQRESPNATEGTGFIQSWAEEAVITPTCVVLRRVNPQLTVCDFVTQFPTSLLGGRMVRLVHKGVSMLASDTSLLSASVTGYSKIFGVVKPEENSTPSGCNIIDEDQQLIDAIRTAAGTLDFDITDGNGNLVSMSQDDRVAFLMALGLHAVGKERASQASALLFLLQSDEEWGRLDKPWQTRVDNYGLLQLDICWIYLQLQNIENLPQVIQRLDEAERVLRKQVNVNFVTLTLLRAEEEHPVSAISAMFVRLFLLQGVAHYHSGNTEKSKERLDWAWALARSLRAVSKPESIVRLVEALGATPFQAIYALRRTEGDENRAAEKIQEDEAEAERKVEDRYRQRKYGICQNGQDYVKVPLVEQLQTVLGLVPNDPESEWIPGGLLRLSNNNLERAIDIYQDVERDAETLSQRLADLDRSQGVVSPRRNKKRSRDNVDGMALASLVSMGMDEDIAKCALLANGNNVERALLWSTAPRHNSSAAGVADNTRPVEDGTCPTVMGPESLGVPDHNQEEASDSQVGVRGGEGQPNAAESQPENDEPPSPEQDAIRLLKQVLGDVLEKQDQAESYLGNSLDEEWGYIEKYRGSS